MTPPTHSDSALQHEQRRARDKPSSRDRRRRKLAVFERDEWTCWICGRKVRLDVSPKHASYATVDHIVPWSEGGSWLISNLRTAHRGCNNLRSNGHA